MKFGGMSERCGRMFRAVRWTIASLLCIAVCVQGSAAYAAGSSAPGFTSGLPVYAIFPKGLYYLNQTQSTHRDVGDVEIRSNTESLFFYYQSDIKFAEGTLAFVLIPTLFDITTTNGLNDFGFYNTYFAVQESWEIGDGLYFGVRLGGYIPQGDNLSLPYGTIEPRFGVTYLKDGWQATANMVFGFPLGGNEADFAPNYFLTDLSITKSIGKWTVGPVAHASTDLGTPFSGYQRQSQFALGGMIGYDLGSATVQAKITRDVTETNYGGKETAFWTNLLIPIKF